MKSHCLVEQMKAGLGPAILLGWSNQLALSGKHKKITRKQAHSWEVDFIHNSEKEKDLETLKKNRRNSVTSFLYKNFLILEISVVLGTAPMIASFFSPLLKKMIVGMLRIPYVVTVEGLPSVFNMKHLSFPPCSVESSAITGWIIRQGPHHGAQNSTITGPSASMTSDCHVSSVTVGTDEI